MSGRGCLVGAPGLIGEACTFLELGDLIAKEALLYVYCILESPAFSCHIQNQAPLAATALYLAIRMHQLPVSVQRLVSAIGQRACFSVDLFWEVAQAVHQTPPAVDYTRFAVLVMANLPNMKATPRMQILSLYDRLMIWLDKANPGVCVQTNSWTAAALQLAIQFYTVSAPQSLLTTHFGITADSLDQKAWCMKAMLTAAADGPHASNTIWSDAIQALLLPSEPGQPEQRLGQGECGRPADVLELVPPQDTVALHAAQAANPITTEAPPAMTCKQEQPVVALAGGAEGPLPAADDAATAYDAAATTSGDHAVSSSREGDAVEEAPACLLLLPARPTAAPAAAAGCSLGYSPPCDGERADKLAASSHEAAEKLQLQTQLLHVAKPSCTVTTAPSATQLGSTGLLASHTHGEQGVMLLPPQVAAARPHPSARHPVGPLQAESSCIQHHTGHCSTSTELQQPEVRQVHSSPHMQQHAPTFPTTAQQRQLPPLQLPGPVSQKLHTLLEQLESMPWPSAMQAVQTPYPPSPTTDVPTFPSVLLQDPGLPARVESVLQSGWSGGSDPAQNPGRAVPVACKAMLPLGGSRSASMPVEGSLQADPPADTHDASAPWRLLPGPLRAAIASAMSTEGAPPAGAVQATVLTPAWGRWIAAWEAGLLAPGASMGKGIKRRRADSKSHGESRRAGITTTRAAGPRATSSVADEAVRRQHTVSPPHRKGSKTATSAVALTSVVRSGEAPLINPNLTEGPNRMDDQAADSEGKAGSVHDEARTHEGLTSLQDDVNQGEPVHTSQTRCISTNPVESKLSSVSRLQSSDPCQLEAAMQRRSSDDTVPVEHGSVPAQHMVQKHNGADAGVNALHQTPKRDWGITTSLAQPQTTALCTDERVAKDALLMLHDEGAPMSKPCDVLTKQPPREDGGGVDRPPPFPDVDGLSAYEVDKIVDRRYYKAGSQVRVQYLVRWKGYGADDDTWQSRNSVRHARQAIQDYEDTL